MKSLRRMIRFMKPYKWVIFIGFFTVVLPVLMELVVPRALQLVIDQGILAGEMSKIWQGVGIMFLAAIIGATTTLGQGICRALVAQGMAYDMRNELFSHVQSFSFGNLDDMQTGELMTRLSSDVDVVRLFSSAGLSLLIRALLMIMGSVVMLLITDWQLTIIMFVVLIIALGIIQVIIRVAQPLFIVVQEKLSVLNTIVQENLAGARVVKAYARETYEVDRFELGNVDYMNQNVKVGKIMAVALPSLTLLTNLGIVALIWYGGLSVIGDRLSLGELIAFNNYLMIGMAPLMLLSNILAMVARADASAGRILEVLDTVPEIQPIAQPHRPAHNQGHLIFEDVTFAYNDNDREAVLDKVSFEAKPGQQIALFGATGAGKSTLINLIPRFYDVTGGSIKLDGQDIRDWDVEALRAQVGLVLQQSTLFSGTVRENIAYGRPTASLEDVVSAAKAAQAHSFIMAMPDGYDSYVEARGANLSGGQKQRLAIARALLIEPTILILDDSTSAVDMETEFKIQEALDTLMQGRTTFIIAQRITSVFNANQIIILDDGRVTATGTHHQLLDISPIYREIYESQVGEQVAVN